MDAGQGASGFARWVRGPMKRGLFGGAKLWAKPKSEVTALRCTRCNRLELFAAEPSDGSW